MRLAIIEILLAAAPLAVFLFANRSRSAAPPISVFGRYQGHGSTAYDGTKRMSAYLTMADGTRLAYDLVLPTRKGIVATERLPALFKYTPYLRTWTIFDERGHNLIADFIDLTWRDKILMRLRYWFSVEGHLFDPLFRTKWLETMVKRGYAVIIVERPGTGASFGVLNADLEANAREIDEILNWIAAQAWSDGRVGMHGDSFQAIVQFAAAATGNPHLKAVFPASSPIEPYDSIEYRGGVYNKAFAAFFKGATAHLERLVTPVDEDKDRRLVRQALAQRRNATMGEQLDLGNPRFAFRDSLTPDGKQFWRGGSLYPFIDRINRAGVPIYMTTGWHDIFVGDLFFWWDNLTVPKRLTVRPLDHTGMDKTDVDLDYAAEAQRWFDRWLKGIDNGIMQEAPIHYYVMGAPQKGAWRESQSWPPAGPVSAPHYLAQGRSGTVSSANDGLLTTARPRGPVASDPLRIDYTTTTGKRSRWTAVNFPHDYPDRRAEDAKALTYTSPPMTEPQELTGHPVAHLWLATEAPDLDVFVYLEEVSADGASRYITEGTLRATHRKLGDMPFKTLGLPTHTHFQSDRMPVRPGEPIELAFALLPTSYGFAAGTRLRIAIAFADADNFETPIVTPVPSVSLLRDETHPSHIELPLTPSAETARSGPDEARL